MWEQKQYLTLVCLFPLHRIYRGTVSAFRGEHMLLEVVQGAVRNNVSRTYVSRVTNYLITTLRHREMRERKKIMHSKHKFLK